MHAVLIQSFIVLWLYATLHSAEIYKEYTKQFNFEQAKNTCSSRGQSLLVAPSYDEYSMFEEIFDNDTFPSEFWIGLHKLDQSDEYQWLTSDKLDVFWKNGPEEPDKKHCTVAIKDGHHFWKTADCNTADKNYICVDYTISETHYSLHVENVDYKTAKENCHNVGQDLAMIKTRQQHNALNTFLISNVPEKDVWIGLEGFGEDKHDYRKFKWIDGEYMNTIDSKLETIKDEGGDKCVIYKGGTWEVKNCNENQPFICTDHFIRPVPENRTNYYDLIDNKKPYTQPLRQITVKRKSKCAAECSKSNNCYMYTYDGLNCELFKKSTIFIDNDVPERKLYLRRYLGIN